MINVYVKINTYVYCARERDMQHVNSQSHLLKIKMYADRL